jgi:apolipoprotein N-acyltransferase
VKTVLLSLGGAVLSVLAFPPFGPGLLIVPGIALFLWALLEVDGRRSGFWVGFLFGNVFFGGLMWWLVELEIIALILVPVQALFFGWLGWFMSGHRDVSPGNWLLLVVGGWAVMELVRYHFPVGGLEWGAAGYALSDNVATRWPASVVGTSGLTVLVVVLAALLVQIVRREAGRAAVITSLGVVAVIAGSALWWSGQIIRGPGHAVSIVQGSTPCPFEHCPPNERLRTFQQHLELTEALEPGSGLVVWSEGSTGSTNADPVNNPEVGGAIAEEARRLGARFVVGSDRVVDDETWINANVYFDASGEIVGEYRKQHPVPFGEYIPMRPLFEWIPALDRVPRDMIRGDGPVLFDEIGSVISFEGGFSRYALGVRRQGAEVIVVATNEASYGPDAPTSDQFIGMTRMRAVELGVPVIHAAVTGKSVVIDVEGNIGPTTDLGEMEILQDSYGGSLETPYSRTGDLLMYLAALAGILTWVRSTPLVGSLSQRANRSSR